MKEKIKLKQAVIVEGRYDKARLESFVDALIIPTHGFSIFTDEERKTFIKKVAEERGIILLTDSDAAGFKIRGYLKGIVSPEQITDVYIPDVFGKEKRKSAPSKEGKLGVEGMSRQVLEDAFRKAGVTESKGEPQQILTSSDFYLDGFYGRPDSRVRREALYDVLGLPQHLSVKQAISIISHMLTREEYQALVDKLYRDLKES